MRFWLILKILLHPIRYAQERIDRWVMARVKRQAGPITISRRRVYILPTRFGYGFGIMTVAMLLGAMNYSNSMAFMLTFLLIALGLVCMHHTHANLVNVELRSGHAPPVFAGEVAHFEVLVDNSAGKPRYSMELSWPHYTVPLAPLDGDGRPIAGRRRRRGDEDPPPITADVAAQSATSMKIGLPAAQRGWLQARVFALGTEFPLGLFHAWTWAELDMNCLVYPRPASAGIPPPPASGIGGLLSQNRLGQDEFAGLRNYQRGDTFKAIHWKSLPKLRSPMVKLFAESMEQELWLDWDSLHGLDAEERLSQLTRWVLDAESENRAYGLRVPGTTLNPARGLQHQHLCLRTLALFEAP
ncbi:MAG TPA: DUF58 domain-containing protein [Nevskiaceae bacterium]|nr:DUF58 domain-containing protein [Nevskiaceae bacterium]